MQSVQLPDTIAKYSEFRNINIVAEQLCIKTSEENSKIYTELYNFIIEVIPYKTRVLNFGRNSLYFNKYKVVIKNWGSCKILILTGKPEKIKREILSIKKQIKSL